MTGNCESFTVTLKEQFAVFPEPSVTVYVSTVVPIGKTDPLGKPAVRTVVAPEQLSFPTGAVKDTMALHWFTALFTVVSPGQTIVGLMLSISVTVDEQVAEFPAKSYAV